MTNAEFERRSRVLRLSVIDDLANRVGPALGVEVHSDPDGPLLAPAAEIWRAGRRIASVSAHLSGVSVLLGEDETLHDLDDVPSDRLANELEALIRSAVAAG